MLTQRRVSGVDLNRLTEVFADVEAEHHLNVPLREDMRHVPTGCRCGVDFVSENTWQEARDHLLRARAQAALEALNRPCPACAGTGVTGNGLRARGNVCVDCDGSGWTPVPLPPFQFRDTSGTIWRADMDERAFVSHRAVVAPVHA